MRDNLDRALYRNAGYPPGCRLSDLECRPMSGDELFSRAIEPTAAVEPQLPLSPTAPHAVRESHARSCIGAFH